MKIVASAFTHPGKHREKNEDNFCFDSKNIVTDKCKRPFKKSSKIKTPVFMGVFDGMGGISAGEKASLIASTVAKEINFSKIDAKDIADTMVGICKKSNRILCEEMISDKKRMGTTASMLCFCNDRFTLCNIGDSPIFICRDGVLKQISHDHTEKENYIQIYGAENLPKKKKYKLTQHIGIFSEELEIEPFVFEDSLQKNDKFIICSDGLTDMVDQDTILEILKEKISPKKAIKKLLSLALENGGKDNITIICAKVK